MKKILAVLGLAILFVAPGSAAYAAGSDGPTPYSVTVEGIQLPAGETFKDGGHVNVRTNQGARGIHFESLNNQPSGVWIGKDFLPWSAFGFETERLCVGWVQISQFNEHFGEGGQQPIGKGCTTVTPTPTPSSEPTSTPTSTPSPTASPTPSQSPTSTPTPRPTASSAPSTTPTTTPSPSNSEVPTITTSSSPTTDPLRLAATGASPEDVGVWGMLLGGGLLVLLGLVIVNVYTRR